jgi:quercetin dioxygenase-like cupin family protein
MAVALTKIVGEKPAVSDMLTNEQEVKCPRCEENYRLGYSDDGWHRLKDWLKLADTSTFLHYMVNAAYRSAMKNISRRNLLYAFGVVYATPLLAEQAAPSRRAAIAKPGESRFAFASQQFAQQTACKVTNDDSAGACSIFEMGSPPKFGPPRHVHHREDEWYYVLAGDFLFEVGGEQHSLPTGGSIWLPRDIPHCWGNAGTTSGKLLLLCHPGGFEKFFDEAAQGPPLTSQDSADLHKLHALHAKYGMELLGPPLFPVPPLSPGRS